MYSCLIFKNKKPQPSQPAKQKNPKANQTKQTPANKQKPTKQTETQTHLERYGGMGNIQGRKYCEWNQTLKEGYFLFPKDLPYLEGLSFSSLELFSASLDGAFEQPDVVECVCAHGSGMD